MNSPLKVLGGLWLSIAVVVIGTGIVLYTHLKTPEPIIVTKTVVVQPTASPSATLAPTVSVKASSAKADNVTVKPTVKGGVSK